MTSEFEEGDGGWPSQVEGLVSCTSRFSTPDTIDRVRGALSARHIELFACIDHAAAATRAGLAMRAATVFVFGNPRAGTSLMQEVPTSAIDLPLRMLVFEDAHGCTWLGFNDPRWIGLRHKAPGDTQPVLQAMTELLAAIAREAAGAPAS